MSVISSTQSEANLAPKIPLLAAETRSRTASPLGARRITIVGATGAVGLEALSILAERGVPIGQIHAVASDRSVGRELAYGNHRLTVAPLDAAAFAGVDVAIFAADASVSRAFVPAARAAGTLVIDNSSAFRMEPGVPLIVPEVNGELLRRVPARGGLVANPNCSAAILAVALEPLRRKFGIDSITVATYQAVSGAGVAAMEELREQCRAELAGDATSPALRPAVFREPCAFNVFSHDSAVDEADGLNVEERKIIEECRKIWNAPSLPITPTCVRVPVFRAHSQAVTVRLSAPASIDDVRVMYRAAAGVRLIDDRTANNFPTPRKAACTDDVLVGRIRHDPAAKTNGRGCSSAICLFLCGDQLRKGAALNAVQIAEGILA